MCYLVAKDRNTYGCFALKTTHGKHLVELKRDLNKAVGYNLHSRDTSLGYHTPKCPKPA